MEMWKKASLRSTHVNHVPLLTLVRSVRVVNILNVNFFRHLLRPRRSNMGLNPPPPFLWNQKVM